MPLYIADYLADTAHLTTAEHGAYLLLIMHYWRNEGLPTDEDQLRRITRMSARAWAASRDNLRSLFSPEWRHTRVDHELAQAIEKSRVNSANAKRSHTVRNQVAAVSQERSQTHSQSQLESKKDAPKQVPLFEIASRETTDEADLFARGKKVLGSGAGGLIASLLKSRKGNVALARSVIEQASTKENPREYIGRILSPTAANERHGVNDPMAGII
jgi:uncharacterized protein YdaU (DUF1376 family)